MSEISIFLLKAFMMISGFVALFLFSIVTIANPVPQSSSDVDLIDNGFLDAAPVEDLDGSQNTLIDETDASIFPPTQCMSDASSEEDRKSVV